MSVINIKHKNNSVITSILVLGIILILLCSFRFYSPFQFRKAKKIITNHSDFKLIEYQRGLWNTNQFIYHFKKIRDSVEIKQLHVHDDQLLDINDTIIRYKTWGINEYKAKLSLLTNRKRFKECGSLPSGHFGDIYLITNGNIHYLQKRGKLTLDIWH